MTTKGIEAQYEEHDRILDDIRRIVDEVINTVAGEEIPILISALLTVVVSAVHQSEMNEEDRFRYITKMLTAAWQDYHVSPLTDLH